MNIRPMALKSLTWLVILLYGLLTFSGMTGWVLCYEPDGQVDIEIAINGHCGNSWLTPSPGQSSRLGEPTQSNGIKAEHSCKDIPLNLISLKPGILKTTGQVVGETLPESLFSGQDFRYTARLAGRTVALFANPPPLKPPIHQRLSTVILII